MEEHSHICWNCKEEFLCDEEEIMTVLSVYGMEDEVEPCREVLKLLCIECEKLHLENSLNERCKRLFVRFLMGILRLKKEKA